MTTWYIGSQNPGTSSFLDTDLVAVNFWVRASVAGLGADGVKSVAAGQHREWERKTAGVRTNFARQLEQFASAIEVGDRVVTFDAAARDAVLVGEVRGDYHYEHQQTIPDHPHVRAVEWLGTVERSQLPDRGAGIENVRGVTVRRLWASPTAPVAALDDAPPAPADLPARGATVTNASDTYSWDPPSGPHRYVLRHAFRGSESAHPLLVVMLNPAANHVPGFRRSTTCHAVRRWGEAHGYDGAVYLNLFSVIEPNSSLLHRISAKDLNGPTADAVLERVGQEVPGPALAGWGNLPPGLDRGSYDRRVAEVERLLDRPLLCLGKTGSGYPRHGRGWRPTDEPIPLR